MGLSRAIGGPEKLFWHDFALTKLTKSCSATRAGSTFPRNEEFCKKKVCKASKAQGKEQVAHEVQENASDLHTVVFANGVWRRNMHETRGSCGFRRGHGANT